MPREDLRSRILNKKSDKELKRRLYEEYGVLGNPFPSAGQTSGHPRMPTEADDQIDNEIEYFYKDSKRKSHVIAITAGQGIGKTNLLNVYEKWLRENLEPQGFFVIRYIPDPEPSFDPLIRSIFDILGENHLKRLANRLKSKKPEELERFLDENLRTVDMKRMLISLSEVAKDRIDEVNEIAKLAQEWLLGLRVYKTHRDKLKIRYRLDTVESKTRALRDLVICSHFNGTLEGIFLLLDELEKQDYVSASKTTLVRYLSAIRAFIDALPQNLFLIMAITIDALDRYSESFPAFRGRLAKIVELKSLQNQNDALELYRFYNGHARKLAKQDVSTNEWKAGSSNIVTEETVLAIFRDLSRKSTIEGIRQRDFLNRLYEEAQESVKQIQ